MAMAIQPSRKVCQETTMASLTKDIILRSFRCNIYNQTTHHATDLQDAISRIIAGPMALAHIQGRTVWRHVLVTLRTQHFKTGAMDAPISVKTICDSSIQSYWKILYSDY